MSANGLIDLAVAVLAFRHQHLVLAPVSGALGLCLLVAHVRQWRWAPRWWDVVGLSVGLGLALGVLSAKSFHFTADDVSRGLKQGFILLKAGQDVLFRIQSCLLLCGPPRHSRYFPTHP